MILYLTIVLIAVTAVVCFRTFCFPDLVNEPHIPISLTKSELFQDGNRLLYLYEGTWYEAISKHDDIVYIYDKTQDKIIRVPYIEGE